MVGCEMWVVGGDIKLVFLSPRTALAQSQKYLEKLGINL